MSIFRFWPFLTLFIAFAAYSAPQCRDLMDKLPEPVAPVIEDIRQQDQALKKIAVQHLYEAAIKFLRNNVTGSSASSSEARRAQNKLNLINHLNGGKHKNAIEIYRTVFDAVELSYFRIKQDLATLEILRQSPEQNKKEIAKMQVRLQVYQRRFAKNYGEYTETRTYLEKVIEQNNKNSVFVETAKKTLMFLGSRKFSEDHVDYAALKVPKDRPTLEQIRELFNSKVQYTRIKLFNDFKREIAAVIKYVISSEVMIGAIDSVFNKFPSGVALKLKNFTGLMNSTKLRYRYLSKILDIETLPETPALRYEELRRKNSTTPNDELLITYVRAVDFSDSWNAIKAHAEVRAQEKNNTIHAQFYKRMLEAEVKAQKLSDISLLEKTSNVDNLIVIIQTAVLLKFAGPEAMQTAGEFWNYVATVMSQIN